jgi:hypothetical protein
MISGLSGLEIMRHQVGPALLRRALLLPQSPQFNLGHLRAPRRACPRPHSPPPPRPRSGTGQPRKVRQRQQHRQTHQANSQPDAEALRHARSHRSRTWPRRAVTDRDRRRGAQRIWHDGVPGRRVDRKGRGRHPEEIHELIKSKTHE